MFPRKPQPTIPNLIFIVKIPSLSEIILICFHVFLLQDSFLSWEFLLYTGWFLGKRLIFPALLFSVIPFEAVTSFARGVFPDAVAECAELFSREENTLRASR